MRSFRTTASIALVVAIGAGAVTAGAQAQDTLARAKDFYASASYEEALQVLHQLRDKTPAGDNLEVAAYQLFCLLALGRNDEARQAIGVIVRREPLFHPSEAQASPRVRAFFEEVRRPLLPDALNASYAKARYAFDRKDMAEAAAEFDRVLALLDEIGPSQGQSGADMKTLAVGFRDLSKLAAAAPPEPAKPAVAAPEVARPDAAGDGEAAAPPPPAAIPPAPAPAPNLTADPKRIYTPDDKEVVKPVSINRAIPTWIPPTLNARNQDYRGVVELIVDERGRVISAGLMKSIHASYDPMLLKAATAWTFKPATLGGVPVKYRYMLEVRLAR